MKKPNLCIVTEFLKQGSLRDILSNNTIKLAWQQRLRLLRSTALGLNYLHSLTPAIIHRDLKSSNLLVQTLLPSTVDIFLNIESQYHKTQVDDSWTVKVADFGFARIKEENSTMTRCGTPSWTAPEIIRGEKYDEHADVYSFGIVMWEVVTRKLPFGGRNFMGVLLDVLDGKRPQVPNDCPKDFAKLMKRTTLGWCNSARRAISALNSSIIRSSRCCLIKRFTATSTPFHWPRNTTPYEPSPTCLPS